MIDGLDWIISVLENIDHTPYLKELCRQYSVYDFDDKFRVIRDPISDLIDKNYEAGYFLSKYPYVLSLYGLDDGRMDHLNVDGLPYLATLACLTWHFRHDHLRGLAYFTQHCKRDSAAAVPSFKRAVQNSPLNFHFGRSALYKLQYTSVPAGHLPRAGSGKSSRHLY